MGLTDFFRPRQSNFFKMLYAQADKTREGLAALEEYMQSADAQGAKRVIFLETEADELRRILIDELNRTFVTPIDREDIFALSPRHRRHHRLRTLDRRRNVDFRRAAKRPPKTDGCHPA